MFHDHEAIAGTVKLNPPPQPGVEALSLLLDVDGTLIAIRDDPAQVTADDFLLRTLKQLNGRLSGALALVSGRALCEIDRIFRPNEFSASGSHGAELRLADGKANAAIGSGLPDDMIAELHRFVSSNDGLLFETKPAGVALHFRRTPILDSECQKLMTAFLDRLGSGFRLIAGKMNYELTSASHSKGTAALSLLDSDAFRGRQPVFIGDDETDEDAFAVVNELGGISVRVGACEHSLAAYRLNDVAAVREWIGDIACS